MFYKTHRLSAILIIFVLSIAIISCGCSETQSTQGTTTSDQQPVASNEPADEENTNLNENSDEINLVNQSNQITTQQSIAVNEPSDEEIIDLIFRGETQFNDVWYSANSNNSEARVMPNGPYGDAYVELPIAFDSPEKLSFYFKQCWSKEMIPKLTSWAQYIQGKYVIPVGDIGDELDYKNAMIVTREKNGSSINVIVSGKSRFGDAYPDEEYIIKYEEGTWKISYSPRFK